MDKKNFDKSYANEVSKDEFIKQHDHHKEEADLGAIWEELQDKKEKPKASPVKKD